MRSKHLPFTSLQALGLVALLALAGLVAAPAAYAQSAGAQLEGRAVDESGAALPGVSVTATNTGTGLERSATTDDTGAFRFPFLPIGSYDVTATLDGFSTLTVEGVELSVASSRQLELNLQVAPVEEVITVRDEAPLYSNSSAIGTVVSTQELENLPINGRQFATLGSLAPGTSLGVNPDPTKVGKLVIGLNGGSGRNVNFTIDGGDNTDDTIGGQLQNFSLEGVAEFNIKTQQYKAEYGRTTGGVLTVVTKSGTNDLNGSAFGFFRDDSLNAKTETQKQAGIDKQPFERQQYGASVGGPIVHDKVHFFVTGERFDQETAYTVATDGVFPNLDGRSFPIDTTDDLLTAKVTFDLSPSQFLQVRYAYQETSDTYGPAPTVTPDSLGDLSNDFQTLLFGYDQVLSADALNQVVVQYSEFSNEIIPNSTTATNYFPSGVTSGQNVNSPQTTDQEKWQFKDDLSYSRTIGGRRHDFKAGVEYVDEGTLGGTFSSGTNGQLSRIDDDANSPISAIVILGGDFRFSTPNEQWRFYVQDDWQVTDRLTLNLGLRYEYTDVLELDQTSNPIWQTLSTQTRYNEGYLRDFQGGRGGVVDPDDNDFAPRLGFTWDVKGDGRHLLRGGWGIYYDFPYTNATVLFPNSAVISNFGLAYINTDDNGIRNPNGTFWQPGDPLPPNQIAGGSIFPPNEVASPTLATPEATQASLGYSTQLTPWLGFNVEVVRIEYENLPFRFRANPRDPATGARRFPDFGNFRLWYGKGEADYEGINLSVKGRLTDKFELQAFYTYSEAEGNVLGGADEFRVTAVEHQPDLGIARDQSVNPLNPLCDACFGPLDTDARHRFTVAGFYRGPWDLTFSGLVRYRSALPYTALAGRDVNGDGFAFDLAPGVSHVNSERGSSFSQVDLRVSKEFSFANSLSLEVIAEVFNLLDDSNPASFVNTYDAAGNRTGLRATAFAGDPTLGDQRVGQLGLRLRF